MNTPEPQPTTDLDTLRAENTRLTRELMACYRTNAQLGAHFVALLSSTPDDLEEAACETAKPAAELDSEADPEVFTVHMLLELFERLGEMRLAGRSLCGIGLVLASNDPGERGKLDGLLLGIAPDAPMTRGELLDGMFHGVLKLRADHPDVFDAGAGSPTVLTPDHPAYEQLLQIAKENGVKLPLKPGAAAT